MAENNKEVVEGQELDALAEAYATDFKYHHDNSLMLETYVKTIISGFQKNNVRNILSLGIGHKVVTERILQYTSNLESYTIIEGSPLIINRFKKQNLLPPNVQIEHSYFETFTTLEKYDAIEMGFILEHVDDPELILLKYRKHLNPGASIYIAVPNAKSLHRQLGHYAGYLDDLYKLSSADYELGHQHYFDLKSINSLVEKVGFKVVNTKGLFMKPFTSKQLESLNINGAVFKALCKVGEGYPDLCNGIYLEVKAV
ncbi:MAG: class I SAM-dependent methyltransferase [Xanthomonadales bacterium]|nr:class I SAM-dependent methyltransferase [Xanthomonadales bacterium]